MSTAERTVPGHRAAALPPEERRSTIVDAALPLLVAHGEAFTTKLLAEAAGIAEGTIFRVFPDKESVIRAAIERAFDAEPVERALAELAPDRPIGEVLEEAVVHLQARVHRIWAVLSNVGPKYHDRTSGGLTVSPGLVRVLEAHRAELVVPPDEAARVLQSLTLALTHPKIAEAPMPPQRIVHLFLHGVTGGASC